MASSPPAPIARSPVAIPDHPGAAWPGVAAGIALAWLFNLAHDLSPPASSARPWLTEPLYILGHMVVVAGVIWLLRHSRRQSFSRGLLFGAAISDLAWLAIWLAAPTLGT